MKPVVQEERTGCGIASVATIAGVSYARAKAVGASMGISASDRNLWSGTGQVRRLCAQFDVRVARTTKRFRAWPDLPDCALLAIKWHVEEGRPCWHWVVFLRTHGRPCVFDSQPALKHRVRRDFGRMKPRWFLPVLVRR